MGIVANVNLFETPEGGYIEVVVNPFGSPVNYNGHYHYRSGSSKQELKGAALNDFLLRPIEELCVSGYNKGRKTS